MSKVICALELILKSRNISVAQFAKQTGLAYNTVKRLVSNDFTSIDLQTIAVICEALEILPGDLLRWESREGKRSLTEGEFLGLISESAIKYVKELGEEWRIETAEILAESATTLEKINKNYREKMTEIVVNILTEHSAYITRMLEGEGSEA